MMNNTDLIGTLNQGDMYAYQTGALQSTLKWIAAGAAPGVTSLSAKNRAALKEFVERQIALIEADAKRTVSRR